jgi:predicted dehydrogenase
MTDAANAPASAPLPLPTGPASANRRDFLKVAGATAGAAALGAGLAGQAALAPSAYAAGSETIRVGLVGCGGRGTGAAVQAANAGPGIKIVALADMFPDRVEKAKKTLGNELGERFDVKPDRCYTGFAGAKNLIDSEVDVVLLCTPPHFRPAHIKYAVEKGRHIFAEKPCAVDGPGVRAVLAACEEAKKKNLAVVSGLCWRYDPAKREVIKRVQEGAVGDIVAMHCSYNTGTLWHRERQPEWSDMEWQLRNWLYFTWLSGDHNVEQHVHSLDKMAWAMGNVYPVKAVGMGGRQVRTDPKFGHIFDHHAVVYEWASGVKLFSFCRQMAGCANDVTDHVMGTKGTAAVMANSIKGETNWKYSGPGGEMYQVEHNELFASIRAGKPINDGDWMAKSSLMGIMGRMATYTGQVITWDAALNSKEDLSPPAYEFGPLPTPAVAVPGKTKFL